MIDDWNDIYEPKDWAPIERAAGVTFSEAQRRRLVAALGEYVWSESLDRPRSKDAARRLTVLANRMNDAAESLRWDAEGHQVIGQVWPWGLAPDPNVVQELLREIATRARKLEGKLETEYPTKADLRKAFVLAVRDVWHEAGGSGKGVWRDSYGDGYCGRLVNLIAALVEDRSLDIPKPRTIVEYLNNPAE